MIDCASLRGAFRSIALERIPGGRGGWRWLCLSVLLRLVAGPVTNHDSSARERRGHTTLGSVSGACCRPPWPPVAPCGSQATLPRNYCASQQRAWRGIEGPRRWCRCCLIFLLHLPPAWSPLSSAFPRFSPLSPALYSFPLLFPAFLRFTLLSPASLRSPPLSTAFPCFSPFPSAFPRFPLVPCASLYFPLLSTALLHFPLLFSAFLSFPLLSPHFHQLSPFPPLSSFLIAGFFLLLSPATAQYYPPITAIFRGCFLRQSFPPPAFPTPRRPGYVFLCALLVRARYYRCRFQVLWISVLLLAFPSGGLKGHRVARRCVVGIHDWFGLLQGDLGVSCECGLGPELARSALLCSCTFWGI